MEQIAILGAGPVGMMNALLAKDAGVNRVVLIDPNEFRLNFGKNMGFEVLHSKKDEEKIRNLKSKFSHRGADLVIVATGNRKAFTQSLGIVRKGGLIILFGVPAKSTYVEVDLSSLYSNEIRILSSYAATERETIQALDMLGNKRLDFGRLITHQYDLNNSKSAFKCAHDALDAMKVVIYNEKKE